MKAWVLHGVNDIRYEEVTKPAPQPDEVLLRVSSCGICGSDIPRIFTTGAHKSPLIPGHEFAGIVEETGKDVDSAWKGKRVSVFPLIPCMQCDCCRQGLYEMCVDYDYLGSRRDGAFAPFVTVPVRSLMEIPKHLTMEEAAMAEPLAVAVHAMRAGSPAPVMSEEKQASVTVPPDKTVVVYGAGTIGLMLVMFLKDAGCEHLYVIGNKTFQKEQAMRLGISADDFCDTRETAAKDFILKKTDGKGADVLFECVGANAVIADCIRLAAPAGRVVTVGNPHADMTFDRDTYWQILRRQLTVRGVWNSSFTGEKDDDWHYVQERLSAGTIRPASFITHRFAPAELSRGLTIMRDKTEPYIKIMINYE